MTGKKFKRRFLEFCSHVKIDSKEQGVIPFRLNGCQRYLVNQIAEGLDEGIHHFIVLKARQLGISTLLLALDNFWLSYHTAVQGAVVTDSDDNKKFFRSVLTVMQEGLPPSHKMGTKQHNSNFLLLSNHSRLSYLTAGQKKNNNLGRAIGVSYLHATESGVWVDQDGLKSLMSALAEINPERLYIFESTAQGFNLFYDMWETAKKAKSQKAIFIGWWRKEDYRIPAGDVRYETYWDGELTPREKEWVKEIKEFYDVEITSEQMAWYRWKLEEEMLGDENMMNQEFPSTPEQAFIVTGTRFFSSERLTVAYRAALSIEVKDDFHPFWRYHFGHHFYDTDVHPTNEQNADIILWDWPKKEGVYVIGGDSAFGSSDQADASAASIHRCFADKMVQVGEFRSKLVNTHQFAWVLSHLAGAFQGKHQHCMMNIETNGPGQAVFEELERIQNQQTSVPAELLDKEPGFRNVVPSIIHHVGYNSTKVNINQLAYGFATTNSTRRQLFNTFKAAFEIGLVDIKSANLLSEMRYITQSGKNIVTEGRAHDDRVIAAALAVHYWSVFILEALKQQRITFEAEMMKEAEEKNQKKDRKLGDVVEGKVLHFLKERGLEMLP